MRLPNQGKKYGECGFRVIKLAQNAMNNVGDFLYGIYDDRPVDFININLTFRSISLSKKKQSQLETQTLGSKLVRPDIASPLELLQGIPNRGNNNPDLSYEKWVMAIRFAKYAKLSYSDVLAWSGNDPKTSKKWKSIDVKGHNAVEGVTGLRWLFYNTCYGPQDAFDEVMKVDETLCEIINHTCADDRVPDLLQHTDHKCLCVKFPPGKGKSFRGVRKMLQTLKNGGRVIIITPRINLSQTFHKDISEELEYFRKLYIQRKHHRNTHKIAKFRENVESGDWARHINETHVMDLIAPDDENLPLGSYIRNVTVGHYDSDWKGPSSLNQNIVIVSNESIWKV